MNKIQIIVAAITFTVASCSSTTYKSTVDPETGVRTVEAKLGGNYGLVPTSARRGNLGGSNSGGVLGWLLPSFNYSDDYDRQFAEATQPTRIEITDTGMIIEGVVDHSTGADIKGNATNRAVRNVSTLFGWLKTMGTIEDVNLSNEVVP